MKKYLFVASLVGFVCGSLVLGDGFEDHIINNHANSDGPDHVQHVAAGNGWFSNLGPTGIRAMLTDDQGLITSTPPIQGRSTSGTTIDPSACW